MSEIVVSLPETKAAAAYRGLMGELRPNSRVMYARAIRDFESYALSQGRDYFGDNLAVLFSDYLSYLRDCGMADSTVQVKRIQLRRYFEWCARVGMIDQVSMHEAQSIKSPKSSGKKAGTWLSEDQMQALLDAPDTSTLIGRRDRAILSLLMGCALRRSEVVALTWGHLVQYEGRWVIKNLSRKHGRQQAYVPVPAWVKKAIDLYSERGADDEHIIVSINQYGTKGTSLTTVGLYHVVKFYVYTLGYGKVTPHDLRRSWARAAKMRGLDLSQIQLMLGHESVETTQRYVNEAMQIASIADSITFEIED